MPGPEPDSLWLDEWQGRTLVSFQPYFWTGNGGNRKARAVAILRRIARRDWVCRGCGDELPVWRRADARYCGEGCRKRAARWRRWVRSQPY